MKVKLVHGNGLRTYVGVLDKNEEAVTVLTDVLARKGIEAASVTAIGAFRRATVGYFDPEAKSYLEIPVEEQVEVLSLIGDVAMASGYPKLHAHVVVGLRDGSTRGGHLLEGTVWPTLEVVITEVPAHLRRATDPETGLPLIDLEPPS